MYLIKYYDRFGNTCDARVCPTLTEVGEYLAAYCNSTVSGKMPTVQNLETGELQRYAAICDRLPCLRDTIACMLHADPNGDYDLEDALANPGVYLNILKRWEEETGNHNYWREGLWLFKNLANEE